MPFKPRQQITNVECAPRSVSLVHFRDARPYGEKGNRDVWLARYDTVRVRIDGTSSAVVDHLTGAFDATTGNLLCAFTDSAPRWIRSKRKPEDFEARVRESRRSVIAPASYADLKSTPGDILGAMWRTRSGSEAAGQIILRPRFVTAQFRRERSSKFIPVIRLNTWIVEVLGKRTRNTAASLVVEFRATPGDD
jgi:hypothetical protein